MRGRHARARRPHRVQRLGLLASRLEGLMVNNLRQDPGTVSMREAVTLKRSIFQVPETQRVLAAPEPFLKSALCRG